jgi:DNA-binding CsgD family transcriptional regulator
VSSSTRREERVRGRQRRKRADAGSVRVSNRDEELLRLVGEQYAISVEQLARLIGRSPRTARWLRDRWKAAGWVESRKLTVAGPSFLWLSGAGRRIAGSPFRSWRPNPTLAVHIEAVTEVRLLVERDLRLGEWLCERALAQQRSADEGRGHLPDGVLLAAGERIAVEVELTLKSRSRLDALLLELAHGYDRIWYFAAPNLVPRLRELAGEIPWQNIVVHAYPPRAAALLG